MLSVVMVVHNEEKVIGRALKSVKKYTGEILVVHDGPCSDKTLAICKAYGAKTFIRPNEGIAEPHRAWLYEKAKGPWILQIDADEFLSPELQKALPELIKKTDVATYELAWPSWDGEKYITHGWPHKKALFRKDKIQFLGLPHCEVVPQGKIVTTPYVLEHQPNYNNFTWKTFATKWRKWAKIHAGWIKKDPDTYDYFPKNSPKVMPRYYAIKKYPVILAIPLGVFQGVLAYKTGGYKMGMRGIKISFMILAYWTMVGLALLQV